MLYTDKADNKVVKLEDLKRIRIEKTYNKLREESSSHDIVSIRLDGALSDFVERNFLLHQILFKAKKVRLIFLSPNAPYVERRDSGI